jgi:hypothetical protein
MAEVRAFLFENEEGGIIPKDPSNPDQPDYAAPVLLH